MSYILSALKKAEQERGGASPLAASLLAAEPARERRIGAAGWLVVTLALAVVVAATAWFLLRPQVTPGNAVVVTTSRPVPTDLPGAGPTEAAPGPYGVDAMVQRSEPATRPLPAAPATAAAMQAASTKAGGEPGPEVGSLPAAVASGTALPGRAYGVPAAAIATPGADNHTPALSVAADPAAPALPALDISGHIYVDARPGASKLFAEGQAWREGDTLPGGVVVQSIEAEAVVLRYLGRDYRVAVK